VWLYILAVSLVFALLGRWVAYHCGRRPREGLILGFLFGPLGVLLYFLLPKFPNPSELAKHHSQWP
jgi:hypothetical protein